MTQRRFVRGLPTGALIVVAALAAAACSSTTTPSDIPLVLASLAAIPPPASEAPTSAPTDVPSTAATEAPSESELPSAVATDIDPCQLITADEAGQLVGTTFGAGKASETEGNIKICTYAAPGPNLFAVEVGIAPDADTAKAAEAQTMQDLQDQASKLPGGLTVIPLPSFADNTDAAMLQGAVHESGIAIGARAIYLLRGTTFFGFSDISLGGAAPPTEQAMKDKATEVLAKLP
jgi:hypothetical protein